MIRIYHGIKVNFSLSKPGEGTLNSHDYDRNHLPAESLIDKYKGSEFTEYLIEIDRNSYKTAEDEKLFSFGEIMQTIKKELVYVEK